MGRSTDDNDPLVGSMSASGATMPVSYWRRQLTIGIWMVGGLAVIVVAYVLIGAPPAAGALTGIVGTAVAGTLAAAYALPLDRLIAHHGSKVFATCSVLVIASVGVLMIVDGRAASPLALLFIAPIVYAAAIYPPRLALSVCTTTVATVIVLSAVRNVLTPADADPTTAAVYVLLLIWLSVGGVAMSHRQWVAAGRLQHLLAEVREAAEADGLTGCLSADAFRARLVGMDTTETIAIAMIDLDDFKAINDLGGHEAGDRVLVEVGRALRAAVRDDDVVGRVGGDEFAVIFSGITPGLGGSLTGRIQQALDTVTDGSCGIAFGDTRTNGTALLRHADAAMYSSKRTRRTSRGTSSEATSETP
jgi:diguanylate cyclase (GGDEF)-like protein